jgi:hypothetical protein
LQAQHKIRTRDLRHIKAHKNRRQRRRNLNNPRDILCLKRRRKADKRPIRRVIKTVGKAHKIALGPDRRDMRQLSHGFPLRNFKTPISRMMSQLKSAYPQSGPWLSSTGPTMQMKRSAHGRNLARHHSRLLADRHI